jgi:hypothetical protein
LAEGALGHLKDADPLGALAGGLFAAAALLGLGLGPRRDPAGPIRLWLLGSLALYVGGYVLIHVEDRHLWPVLAPAAALAVATLHRPVLSRRDGDPGDDAPALPRRRLNWALAALLLASLGWQARRSFDTCAPGAEAPARAAALRRRAQTLPAGRYVIADDWADGLIVSHYADRIFLGQAGPEQAVRLARELPPDARLVHLPETAPPVVLD